MRLTQAARAQHTPGGFVRWSANGAGGPGFHGPGCPNESAKLERQAEWRAARARQAVDAGGARSDVGSPRQSATSARPQLRRRSRGQERGGERREEPQSREAGASAKALDKAAASRMREVTWDTRFSSPLPRSFRSPRAPLSPHPRPSPIIPAQPRLFPRHARAHSHAIPATTPVPTYPRPFPMPFPPLPRHSRESGKP